MLYEPNMMEKKSGLKIHSGTTNSSRSCTNMQHAT